MNLYLIDPATDPLFAEQRFEELLDNCKYLRIRLRRSLTLLQ